MNKENNEYRRKPVIHLGYGKSASTSLQECIFSNIPEVYFYGKGKVSKDNSKWLTPEGRSITHKLVNVETYSRFTDNELNDIDRHLKNAENSNSVFLFSNEQFSESVAPIVPQQIKTTI